ncbi:hypothetical protein AB0392_44410 [Nonomuraea angiospora]|uniref:hypothetical protein n=1 Tax=Nonomuraea angiospora TaxID=46172 RepID=UPI00344B5017
MNSAGEESGALPAHPSPQHRLEDRRFGIEMDDPLRRVPGAQPTLKKLAKEDRDPVVHTTFDLGLRDSERCS